MSYLLRKPEADSDFYFVEADDAETAVSRIIELVKRHIAPLGLDPIRDVQVLCPIIEAVWSRSLNIELLAALNPAGDRKVERFGWTFAPGDKVMQIENDYDEDVTMATGNRYSGAKRLGPAALVEARRVAAWLWCNRSRQTPRR